MRNAFAVVVLLGCTAFAPLQPAAASRGHAGSCEWRQVTAFSGTTSRAVPLTVEGSEWKLEVSSQSAGRGAARQSLEVSAQDQRRRYAGWARSEVPGVTEMEMDGGPGRYTVLVHSRDMRWDIRVLECRSSNLP